MMSRDEVCAVAHRGPQTMARVLLNAVPHQELPERLCMLHASPVLYNDGTSIDKLKLSIMVYSLCPASVGSVACRRLMRVSFPRHPQGDCGGTHGHRPVPGCIWHHLGS